MSDDVYRPKKKIAPEELGDLGEDEAPEVGPAPVTQPTGDPLAGVKNLQQQVARERGQDFNEAPLGRELPFEVKGKNIPPEFKAALQRRAQQSQAEATTDDPAKYAQGDPEIIRGQKLSSGLESHVVAKKKQDAMRVTGSDQFENLLQRLADKHHWEEFAFPSKSKFYTSIPEKIHVRAMTGEEEQILATPRWVKKGRAIDMIFQRCIREQIDTDQLLSIDRTHLLIFLRGISYTPEYDVEVKCGECGAKFTTVIDLNALEVEECPDTFSSESLSGVLPASGFSYRYRLSTGSDEVAISTYREKRIQQYGDQSEDDTLLYRTAILLEEIEGLTNKKEIQFLLKRLPIADVVHLRNEISDPPFGVDTNLLILCPYCTEEFATDLPLETNFFFPRKKKEDPTQA